MTQVLLQLSHIFQSFGNLSLFEDLSFSVNQGDIFALIGENGAGKTTLLQMLLGTLTPESGQITKAPHLTIGFLPQEISLPLLPITCRAYIEQTTLVELEKQMADCLENPHRLAEWSELHERYEQLGGYKRIPIEKVTSGLKLDSTLLDQPMNAVSSGQRVRIALAKALVTNPDLLLLDEPTNHLDLEMIAWLENLLISREGATIIVSHDRKFLNKTCNHLIEIKEGHLTTYGGNYDFYLHEQERLIERQIKAFEEQSEEKAQLKKKLKEMTFSKGKATPSKDRNVMAYDRRGEKHQKSLQRNAEMLKARLDEIEANPLPHPKPKTVKGIHFSTAPLTSNVAIELEMITKRYGEREIFTSLTLAIKKGERLVIMGPNGCGKTTLLRCMAGLEPIDEGVIRYAPSATIAYLDQEIELLPMEESPLHYFESRFNLTEEEIRRELHKAGIGGADLLQRPFSTMSAGQRKRLMLLSLILEKPNVLLLDEPTNHLDLLTLEALEKALLQFEGALVAISHDATFIEKIATTSWTFLSSQTVGG